MTIEERINEVRIKLNNPGVQSYQILKDFYYEAHRAGYLLAQQEVDLWITAEKVDELYQEQR